MKSARWLFALAAADSPKNQTARKRLASARLLDRRIRSDLQFEPSSAGAELVDFHTVEVRDRDQQVRCRFFLGNDVPIAFQLAVRAAEQERGRIAAIVEVAVAHAAAEVDQ